MRVLAALAPLVVLAACRTAAPPAIYSCDVTTARGEFVVCGDTREWIFGEFWRAPQDFERRAVIARLVEERPDFVVNTGDLVAHGSWESDWETFDAEMAPLRAAGVAYLPVLGNHDLWPSTGGGLANWFAHFPSLGGRRWYDVRYGYVDLVVLDTNDSSLTAEDVAAEDAWYADRLAAADADASVRCVIVACHQPPITNSLMHGSSPWVRAHFVDPARSHPKVKAFVCGHVHSYEHFIEGGVHFVVSGGGGAPLMDVAGPGGEHADLYDGPRGHHFCRFVPRDDRVDVEMVRMDDDGAWTVADRWSIALE
jgi:predicted phosphohydrolase